VAAGLGCVLVASAALADLPFLTEEAETIEPGEFSLDIGIGYRDAPRDFGVQDRESQLDIGKSRLSFGLGRAELQLSGVPVILIDQAGERNTNSGDWVFGTKVWLLQEHPQRKRPSISFIYEVKLPNASDELGGATDETDFFGTVIVSTRVNERDAFHANLGLGILGNPFSNASQNDVAILRLAWDRRWDRQLLGLEAIAQTGPMDTDDPSFLRAVYARNLGKWVIHGGVGVGIGEDSDNAVVDFGVRRRFKLGQPGTATRRNDW